MPAGPRSPRRNDFRVSSSRSGIFPDLPRFVGQVLGPPCSRQRVYRPVLLLHIAGARHGLPDLVLAPQRGLEEGSPLQDGPFRLSRCSETGATLCMGSVVNLANIAMPRLAFRPKSGVRLGLAERFPACPRAPHQGCLTGAPCVARQRPWKGRIVALCRATSPRAR